MTQTEELVTNFISLLQHEKPLLDDAIKMITITQQHEHKYIGGVDVKPCIDSIYTLMTHVESFTVSDIESDNECVKDVKIVLHLKYEDSKLADCKTKKLTCRCVKEAGVRQPRVDGIWGINVGSFKFVD